MLKVKSHELFTSTHPFDSADGSHNRYRSNWCYRPCVSSASRNSFLHPGCHHSQSTVQDNSIGTTKCEGNFYNMSCTPEPLLQWQSLDEYLPDEYDCYVVNRLACTMGNTGLYYSYHCDDENPSGAQSVGITCPVSCTCPPCPGDSGYIDFNYEMCWEGETHWSCTSCTCINNSPIIVDVLGNGFALTGVAGGVSFNFNGEGPEHIGWTDRSSDD